MAQGIDVEEREHSVVFVDSVAGNVARNDLAEDGAAGVAHGPKFSPDPSPPTRDDRLWICFHRGFSRTQVLPGVIPRSKEALWEQRLGEHACSW